MEPPGDNGPQATANDLIRSLVPALLRAGSFQVALQLLAWELRDAFELKGVYVLEFAAGSLPLLLTQAGPPAPYIATEAWEARGSGLGPSDAASGLREGAGWVRPLSRGTEPAIALFELRVTNERSLVVALEAVGSLPVPIRTSISELLEVLAPVLSSVLDKEQQAHALIEAQRLVHDTKAERRARNAFLARMSHDLRTPLGVILGFAQLLEMERLSAKQATQVAHILSSGRHLLTLINQVLELTTIDSGRLTVEIQPVNLGALIAECVAGMGPKAAEKRITIGSSFPTEEAVWVLTDPSRLRQILYNLLSNAIKFNTSNGLVKVAVSGGEGGRFVLSVTDTGPGIPRSHFARLFEPFDRLDMAGEIEGHGLGLAISKAVAEAVGARLSLESRLGRGSTFSVDLPTAEPPSSGTDGGRSWWDPGPRH